MVVIASTYKVPYTPDPTVLTGDDLMSLEAFLPPGENSVTLSAVRYVYVCVCNDRCSFNWKNGGSNLCVIMIQRHVSLSGNIESFAMALLELNGLESEFSQISNMGI